MKTRKCLIITILCLALAASAGHQRREALANKREIGYRNLLLGQTKEQVLQGIKTNFSNAYTITEEGDNSIVMKKAQASRTSVLLELLFDHSNHLYKLTVKMRKIPDNPGPEEVMKVLETKYGKPAKRDISSSLDLTAWWYLDSSRYTIFFQNISSWDKFDVEYVDTVLLKGKEDRDRELNRKPARKELDF